MYEGGESGQCGGHDGGVIRLRPPHIYRRSRNGRASRPVPEGDEYLKTLWQNEAASSTVFHIEPLENDVNGPVIKKLWRIL